jgi:hypothetical protein
MENKYKKQKKVIVIILLIVFALATIFVLYNKSIQLKEFNIYKNNSNGYSEVNFIDPSTANCLIGGKGMNMDYCYSHFYSNYKSDKVYYKDININWLNVHCYKISNSTWGCGRYVTKEYFSNLDYSGGIVEFPLCSGSDSWGETCYAYIISRGKLEW